MPPLGLGGGRAAAGEEWGDARLRARCLQDDVADGGDVAVDGLGLAEPQHSLADVPGPGIAV